MRKPSRFGTLLLLDQVAASLGNFLTTVFLARVMTSAEFGAFTICWLATLFAGTVTSGAITFPMMSDFPRVRTGARTAYLRGNSTLLVVGSAIMLAVVLGTFIALKLFHDLPSILIAAAWCAAGVQIQELARRIAMLSRNASELLISDFACYGLRLPGLYLVSQYVVLDAVAAAAVVGTTAMLSALAVRNAKRLSWRAAVFAWGKNRAAAKTLLPAGVLQWGAVNFFMVAASALLSAGDLGRLRMCQALASLSNPLIQAAENIVPTRATADMMSGVARFKGFLLRSMAIGVLLLAIPVIISLLWADSVLALVYGVESTDSAPILTAFMAVQISLFGFVVLRAGLRTVGATRSWLISNLAAAIASLGFVGVFGLRHAVWVPCLMLLANLLVISIALPTLMERLRDEERKSK